MNAHFDELRVFMRELSPELVVNVPVSEDIVFYGVKPL